MPVRKSGILRSVQFHCDQSGKSSVLVNFLKLFTYSGFCEGVVKAVVLIDRSNSGHGIKP